MKKRILSLLLLLLVALPAIADVVKVPYSRELYEKAVMGDGEAMFQLSVCYMNGNGVAADYDKSDYWLERAAQEGQPNAMAAISAMRGRTGLSDAKRRELAAEEKRERERLEKNIDYSKYNDALVKKAQSGDAEAQYKLGKCYYYGKGVAKDYNKAVEWYRKAAEQGNADAQCNLGYCYGMGNGVTQDYTQAVYWFRKSAEQGNAFAQCNLGNFYYNGRGVSQDYNQAIYWFRKSVDQDNSTGQGWMGYCYERGHGVSKDINQAVEWYRKAARQGDEYSQKALKRLGYSW